MNRSTAGLERVKSLAEAYAQAPLEGGHLSHRINLAEVWRGRLEVGEGEANLGLTRRDVLISNCCGLSNQEVELAYLRVMAFGYGDVGYGPYRADVVARNMESMGGPISFLRDLWTRSHESWSNGYEYLCSNQVARLGPSFATKLLYFSSPQDDRAPILDSVVSGWLWKHGVATKSEPIDSTAFDIEMYRRYVMFADEALDRIQDLLPDQEARDRGVIEYLIFQDHLFHRATWGFPSWLKLVE